MWTLTSSPPWFSPFHGSQLIICTVVRWCYLNHGNVPVSHSFSLEQTRRWNFSRVTEYGGVMSLWQINGRVISLGCWYWSTAGIEIFDNAWVSDFWWNLIEVQALTIYVMVDRLQPCHEIMCALIAVYLRYTMIHVLNLFSLYLKLSFNKLRRAGCLSKWLGGRIEISFPNQ
jgi:hypothetical protein